MNSRGATRRTSKQAGVRMSLLICHIRLHNEGFQSLLTAGKSRMCTDSGKRGTSHRGKRGGGKGEITGAVSG